MQIGIVSDTHDHLDNAKKAVEVFKSHGIRHVVHCGDMVAPFVLKIFREAAFDSFHAVFGNNDGEWLMLARLTEPLGKIAKPPAFIQIEDVRLAILHEPMPDDVMAALPVDIVAFGHTHERVARHGSPLVVNPGECCGWLTGKPSIAIVDTDKACIEHIDL